ncbi:MAG: hypothetical protein CAF44_003910 [Nitrospira sp. CG24D]|nr:MAG: hypothetical protein CAF44_003910 [Nitrospira sp. CG24D]
MESSKQLGKAFLLVGVFLSCSLYPFLTFGESGEDIPGLQGLSVEEIVFWPIIGVETANSVHDTNELLSRAIMKLARAGIVTRGAQSKSEGEDKAPALVLTFLAKKVDGCKDKLLYTRNLELFEHSVRQREPKISTRSVMFGGPLSVEVIGIHDADQKRFSQDIDRLLDMFISSYRSAN